jgi:hypothetical protein
MNTYQTIFDKLKELLIKLFDDELNQFENGSHLTLGETGIWIEFDGYEFTIGHGLSHWHYNPERDDVDGAITMLINLLTKRIRITTYHKGNKEYKHKVEIELANSKFQEIGTTTIWFHPFWKKTITNTRFKEHLIDYSLIESDIIEIKSSSQNST